jgi:Copper type II ascorbate-dependent monooxygenase, C-terminal domain
MRRPSIRMLTRRKLGRGLFALVTTLVTLAGLGACGGAKSATSTTGGASGGGAGVGGAAGGQGGGAAGETLPEVGAVTYYKDVGPILDGHCVGCHVVGGIAPFTLVGYDEAMKESVLLPSVTKARQMPPWPPSAGCGDFRDERVLTLTEIAKIDAWVKQGAPAGNPADAPAAKPAGTNLGTPSATLDPGADYHPNDALTDDYHCTLIDPGLAAAQDLIGFNIHPGSGPTVHHVLLFSVSKDKVAAAQAADAAEAGAGWTCFGGTGVDGTPTIGGWVPGSGQTAFPPPTGIHLEAGTQIVMQIHYNLLTSMNVTDRTTADLFYAATPVPVLKRAAISAVLNTTFLIPAGVKSQTVTGNLPINGNFDLWGVVPHMHVHGVSIHVDIGHPDGTSTCGVDIPAWNFHWQQFYYYQQAIKVKTGDTIHVACTYDNSAMNQPVIRGVKQVPMPLHWGEKTTDEMCLNYLYFTLTDPRDP